MPVSVTAKQTAAVAAARRTSSRTSPAASVNFTRVAEQVDQDLPQPPRRRVQIAAGSPGPIVGQKRRPFSLRAARRRCATASQHRRRRRTCSIDSSSRPASILERSSTSLISASSCSPQRLDRRRGSRAASVGQVGARRRGSARSRGSPLSGVRSSWLMLARNSLLARVAASAAVAGVLQLLLGLLLLGDVAGVDHDRPDGRVVQQVAGVGLDPPPRPVGVPDPRHRAARAARLGDHRRQGRPHDRRRRGGRYRWSCGRASARRGSRASAPARR